MGGLGLADGLAGEAYAKFLEYLAVHFGEHDRGVNLTTFEERQAGKRLGAVLVPQTEHGESHEHFVGVKTWVVAVEVGDLGLLNGFDHLLRNEADAVVDACQMLGGIEDEGGAGAEERTRLGRDEGAVGQLNGGGRYARLGFALTGGDDGTAILDGDLGLLHQEGNLVDLVLCLLAIGQFTEGGEVAADDLGFRSLAADCIVGDAVTNHIDTHVGGRLIRALAVDALEDGIQDGEDFNVAVVVDRGDTVGIEMERVNHVDIVEVGGGCFVSNVYGMLEGEVPNGECLKLRITRLDATLALVIELTEAGGHLAAAGAGSSDDHKRTGSLDILVLAETLFGVDEFDVGGIAFNNVMVIHADAHAFETASEGGGAGLTVVVRDDDTGNEETAVGELIAQTQNVHIVGDAEVVADFVRVDVEGTDDDDDLGIVTQLHQHVQLTIGLETRQHAAGMVVVEELAAKLHVEFVSKLGYALLDVLRLNFLIFLVVESVFHDLQSILIFLQAAKVRLFCGLLHGRMKKLLLLRTQMS